MGERQSVDQKKSESAQQERKSNLMERGGGKEYVLVSGRREEQAEKKQCRLRTGNAYFVAVIWSSGTSLFCPCMLP